MKNLLFNVNDFKLDEKVPSSVGEIKTVVGFDDIRTEAWQISDWNWNWSTIRGEFDLEKTPSTFFAFG